MDSSMSDTVRQFDAKMQETVKLLGGKMAGSFTYALGLSSDTAGDAPDFTFAKLISGSGSVLYDRVNTSVARGQGGAELGAEMQRMIIAALKDANIAAWAQEIISGLNPATMSAEQLTRALDDLATAAQKIASAEEARKSLIYSLSTDEEKLLLAQRALADAGLPNTISGFKAMAGSLDLTTAAGQDTFSQMISLKGALDDVTKSAALSNKMDSLRATQLQLAIDLMKEQGYTEYANNIIRQTAIQGMSDLEIAIYDENQANQKLIESLRATKAAQSAYVSAMSSIDSILYGIADTIKRFHEEAVAAAGRVADARNAISQAYFAAQDELVNAQKQQISLNKQAADSYNKFSQTIQDFLDKTSPRGESLLSLKSKLQSTATLASAGDATSQERLVGIAQQVIDKAQGSSSTAQEFARQQAWVSTLLKGVVDAVKPTAAILAAATTPSSATADAQAAVSAAGSKVSSLQQAANAAGASISDSTRVTMAANAPGTAADLLGQYQSAVSNKSLADQNASIADAIKPADLTSKYAAGSMDGLLQQLTELITA
ncbi:MAG: hypothetical protein NTX56_05445, partial [Proteobacteria bacterium]|nr:hypothetical protein [Pseudomonadota bacterium]